MRAESNFPLEREGRGHDVEILLKFMRHGERDKDGNLEDIGRDITRQRAQESGIQAGDFDAVKAIGSDAGPQNETSSMQRALETAHIYAQEIEGDEAFKTRVNSVLSFENLATPKPYDHNAIYRANLPANFDELDPEEKIKATKIANASVVKHLFKLKGEQVEQFKKELAGSSAYVIEHYVGTVKRLKDGSKVLIPAGGHGAMLEFILQQALVFENKDGKSQVGFDDLEEIGGELDPSEAFNITIKTDASGGLEDVVVSFDRPDRPQGEMHLDRTKVRELSEFYQELHPVKKWEREK
ncbi:MAG: hypothetical protein WCV71_05100 [Patescibacteria group bacterium]|jgi:hypothetical protein